MNTIIVISTFTVVCLLFAAVMWFFFGRNESKQKRDDALCERLSNEHFIRWMRGNLDMSATPMPLGRFSWPPGTDGWIENDERDGEFYSVSHPASPGRYTFPPGTNGYIEIVEKDGKREVDIHAPSGDEWDIPSCR